MRSHINKLGLVFSFLIGLGLPLGVHAAEFNDAQKKEMGQIVREYLMKNPEILRDVIGELNRKEAKAKADGAKDAIKKYASDIYRADGDLVAGNPAGDVTMVEFFDYNCGFCKRSLPDVLKLIKNDAKLKFVIKEFPILGPGSMFAAQAAIASRKQGKYWKFHLALMKHRGAVNEAVVLKTAEKVGLDLDKLKKDMKAPEVTDIIRRNHAVAQALAINGTPAFLVGEKLFPGAVGYDRLSAAADKIRKNGGCTVC